MKRDLLLEIGTEEIPAHAMPNLLREMKRLAGEMLTEQRISYDEIRTLGTPRSVRTFFRRRRMNSATSTCILLRAASSKS